jgi:TolB-like protein
VTDSTLEPIVLSFGEFELDLGRACFRRFGGAEIALRPKAFDLLRTLAENAGRVLCKEYLLDAVWPGLNVTDDSLTQCVRDVRLAIGDRTSSVIRTVHKKGYRLDADVRYASSSCLPPPISDISDPTKSSRAIIAILEFDNRMTDPKWDSFCKGLVEDLIFDLARSTDFRVIAAHSSRHLGTDVSAVERAFGAKYVLRGSVRPHEAGIRVNAQLIDSKTTITIWADRFDCDEGDLFVVQQEIVDQIVAALVGREGQVFRAELADARRKPPNSLRAHELCLLGTWHEAELDRDNTLLSIRYLRESVAADPTLARAWVVLAWAYGNAAQEGWPCGVPDAWAASRDAILKAATFDKHDGLLLITLAGLRLREGEVTQASKLIERAQRTNNKHPDFYTWLAPYVASVLDRPDQGMELVKQSIKFNPFTPTWYFQFHLRTTYFASNFALTLKYFDEILPEAELHGRKICTQRLFKVLALAQLGRRESVAAAIRDLQVVDPGLQTIKAQMVGLGNRARALFIEGVSRAGLENALPVNVMPASSKIVMASSI